MAKRKTDPEGTTAPSRRRKSPTDAIPATTAGPKAARARLKSDASTLQAAPASAADAAGRETVAVVLQTEPEHVPHDQIALRAYHLYLERGGRGGDPVSDWVRAERELRQQRALIRH
jgi:hypothetical protein